MEEKKSNNNN
jgi:hypothetical protein